MNSKIIYLCEDEYIIRDTPAQRWADLMAVRIEIPQK